jgi:hypothetical protein
MTNEQHTPGPWKIRTLAVGYHVIEGNTGQHVTDFVKSQDAGLIAAAPELLDACRDMLEKIHRMYPNDWSGTKAKARAAITKATAQPNELGHDERAEVLKSASSA